MAARTKTPTTPTEHEDTSPAGWKPAPGDTIEGLVTDIVKIESEFGDYPMLTLTTDDGDVNVHAFHSVLQKGLTKLRPGKGDMLRITYHGQKETKAAGPDGKRRSYHNYTVTDPNKPVEDFSWGDPTDDVGF